MAELVSVVVPAHDAASYLSEAIESVLAQGRRELEIVVVDDGSSDPTACVAERFGPPVRVVRQRRAGPAAARNRGARESTGQWLSFLDADDLWEPGKLARQLDAFAQDPELGLVFGHVQQFASPDAGAEAPVDREPRPGYLAGALVTRRAVWARVGPFDESLRVGELLDWLLRARALGVRERMLDERVLRRRVHGANMTRGNPPYLVDYTRVLRDELERRRARTV